MKYELLILTMLLTACAGVSRAPYVRNDATEVTIAHGTGAVLQTKYQEAQAYCKQYGKNAYLRAQIDAHNTVFDCK